MGLEVLAKLAAQRALSLVGGKGNYDAGIKAAEMITSRGPRGEYYVLPKTVDQPELWSHLRRLITEGQMDPVLEMNTAEIPAKQVMKAQKASQLAGRVRDQGLPRKGGFMSPEFDALALKLNQQGTKADAVAALMGPQSTKDSAAMFLNDLSASDVPGAGGSLLNSLLRGPLYPDAKELIFTPLTTDDTMNFYRRFGMKYASPDEAMSDDRLRSILEALGETYNAKDLGVGVIRRAEGGQVTWNDVARSKIDPRTASTRNPRNESIVLGGKPRVPLSDLAEELVTTAALGPLGRVGKLAQAGWKTLPQAAKTAVVTVGPAAVTGDPTMLGNAAVGLASYSPEAEASNLDKLISAGRSVFKPTTDAQSVLNAMRSGARRLGSVAEFTKQPGKEAVEEALDSGSNIFGFRVVPYSENLSANNGKFGMYKELPGPMPLAMPSQRHRMATTPGWHAAPVERPGQMVPIVKRYIDEGFRPKAGVVHSRVDTPILISDAAGEHADVLAAKVGATEDLRRFIGSSSFDPTMDKEAQKAQFITEWLKDKGIDVGIYNNVVEGMHLKRPTTNFISEGDEAWNPSMLFFSAPKDLAHGGQVRAPENLPQWPNVSYNWDVFAEETA